LKRPLCRALFLSACIAHGSAAHEPDARRAAPVVRALSAESAAHATSMRRVDAARELLQAGRASGDPAALDRAQALLAGVPDSNAASVEVLVLRATIEQTAHRFDAAKVFLDRALARVPLHVQARLTRATIGHVRGDLAAARADCRALHEPSPAVAMVCLAINDSLSGHNERALAALKSVGEPALRPWALSLAGEIHEQQGDLDAAVRAYEASLALSRDAYTTVALADALIAQRRWEQAETLLAPLPDTDTVALRRWIAARALGRNAIELEADLGARFARAEKRGKLLHAREAALFALERGDAKQALKWALDNWSDQREPADLRILAAAARTTDNATALTQVRQWLQSTGLDDVRVQRTLQGRR
jgi:tetratricopeptide (TPR) repeat protein